jgi:hypothetical protein
MSTPVRLHIPIPRQKSTAEVVISLSRLPIAGESIDFDEDYPSEDLAGESFTVHHVAHVVDHPDVSEFPSVILR